jgi:hypothetical protein
MACLAISLPYLALTSVPFQAKISSEPLQSIRLKHYGYLNLGLGFSFDTFYLLDRNGGLGSSRHVRDCAVYENKLWNLHP